MKENSLMAFIAGAAVGALLGILLAPEKGEVTRRKIKDAADEGIDLEPVRTKIRERLDDIEEKITERMADGKMLPPSWSTISKSFPPKGRFHMAKVMPPTSTMRASTTQVMRSVKRRRMEEREAFMCNYIKDAWETNSPEFVTTPFCGGAYTNSESPSPKY